MDGLGRPAVDTDVRLQPRPEEVAQAGRNIGRPPQLRLGGFGGVRHDRRVQTDPRHHQEGLFEGMPAHVPVVNLRRRPDGLGPPVGPRISASDVRRGCAITGRTIVRAVRQVRRIPMQRNKSHVNRPVAAGAR